MYLTTIVRLVWTGADPGFFAGGGGNDGRVQRAPSAPAPTGGSRVDKHQIKVHSVHILFFIFFAIVKKFVEKKIGGREQGGGVTTPPPPPPGSAPAGLCKNRNFSGPGPEECSLLSPRLGAGGVLRCKLSKHNLLRSSLSFDSFLVLRFERTLFLNKYNTHIT